MSDVYFKKPDGSYVVVDSSEAESAQQRGYVPSSPEEAEAGSQSLAAAGEGAFRGATMGFGDSLLRNIESEFTGESREDVAEKMRLRAQENPVAAGAGQLAGGISTAVLSGGASIEAQALEGGLFGLGEAVSESFMERDPLTIEKMAAGLTSGALTGAGIGLAFKGLGKAASVGLRKLGGSAISDTLGSVADDVEWGALSHGNKGWARANQGLRDDILAASRKLGINAADDAAVAAVESEAASLGKRFADSVDDLERQFPLAGDSRLRQELVDQVESRFKKLGFDKNPAGAEGLDAARKQLSKLSFDDSVGWKDVWNWQESLPSSGALGEVKKLARDYVVDTAEQISNRSGQSLKKLGREIQAVDALREGLVSKIERLPSANLEHVAAAGFFGGPKGVALALGKDAVNHQVSKRGGYVLGSVLRKLSDSKAIEGMASMLEQRVGQLLLEAPAALGAFRVPLERAAANGGMALLDEYVRLASKPGGAQLAASIGLTNETPEEVEAAGSRLAAIEALRSAQGNIDDQLEAATDRMLSGKGGRFSSPSPKDFAQRSASIRDLLGDPSKAFEAMPPEIAGGAPALSGELTNKILQGAQFLDSKMPKDPNEGMPAALKPNWQPSAEQLSKWYRYVEAVEQPAKVLEKMANGSFAKEHKEVLENVYPELYADVKMRLMEKLATSDKSIDYKRKAALAQVFGPEVLGLRPGAGIVLQSAYMPSGADAPKSKGGTRPDGRQVLNPFTSGQTEAQQIEGDE